MERRGEFPSPWVSPDLPGWAAGPHGEKECLGVLVALAREIELEFPAVTQLRLDRNLLNTSLFNKELESL